MAVARRLNGLSSFLADDLKHVFQVIGFDMTGASGLFSVAEKPGETPLIEVPTSLLEVAIDEDGVPTSSLEAYAAQATVAAAVAALLPADGSDLPLSYDVRVTALPGDLGTEADTTLLYGTYILKGSVDG